MKKLLFTVLLAITFCNQTQAQDTPLIGEIKMFAGNFAPRGWAFCDGQVLAISSNTSLFSIIGTTYGGDGRSSFALPDLRGRAPIHEGTGPGLSPRKLGSKYGSETNILSVNSIPNHNHDVQINLTASVAIPTHDDDANSDEATDTVLAKAVSTNGSSTQIFSDAASADSQLASFPAPVSGTINILPVTTPGGQQPVNNIQPALTVNYIIALQGIYPSRQ